MALAPSLDVASSGHTAAGATPASLTVSHTVAATATLLVVGVVIQNGSSQTIGGTSVTYAGANMTLLSQVDRGSNTILVGLYYKANPATGANNIVLTPSAGAVMTLCATSWSQVNPATPITGNTTNNGTGTALATNSYSPGAFDLSIDISGSRQIAVGTRPIALSAPTGTSRKTDGTDDGIGAAGADVAAGMSTKAVSGTLAWTSNNNNHWANVGAIIKGLSTAGPIMTGVG